MLGIIDWLRYGMGGEVSSSIRVDPSSRLFTLGGSFDKVPVGVGVGITDRLYLV